MRAIYLSCKFLDRGVDCWNAPIKSERFVGAHYDFYMCGCTPAQKMIEWRSGMSQSHIRKIARQHGVRYGR